MKVRKIDKTEYSYKLEMEIQKFADRHNIHYEFVETFAWRIEILARQEERNEIARMIEAKDFKRK